MPAAAPSIEEVSEDAASILPLDRGGGSGRVGRLCDDRARAAADRDRHLGAERGTGDGALGPAQGERRVRSNPGATPLELHLWRRDPNIVVRLEKEGCQPKEVRLKRTVSGWIAGDLLPANPMNAQGLDSASDYPKMAASGLALTFGIDFLSGSAFNLPKLVQVTLDGC